MKNVLSSVLVPAFALMTLNASAATLSNGGALTVSWTLSQQLQPDEVIFQTTTKSATATNYISKYKATIKTSTLANATLLSLLANSFNTAFTTGTKLATDSSGSVYVVDKTGSNIVLDVSAVVSVQTTITVISDSYSDTKTVPKTGPTTESITGTRTETAFLQLSYDDSSRTTADGTQTTFQFYGLSAETDDVTKNLGSGNFTLQNGCGSGVIRGVPSLISKGTYTGSFKINLN